MASSTFQTRTFSIQYAGLVPQINANIDPSGRTDLLKVLDRAQADGHITLNPSHKHENALLELDHQAVVVRSKKDNDVLLVVPLHMLGSVGYVIEDDAHIVALKIGEVYESMDFVDLAVFQVKEKKVAEDICHHFDESFQRLYRETMAGTVGLTVDHGPVRSVSTSSFSPKSDVVPSLGVSNVYGVTEVSCKTKHHSNSNALSLSTSSTSVSSKNSMDRINEYLTMLSVCLSHEELNKFALLLKRWRAKEMPVLEFAQKLMELYGPERKHLLARMKSLLRDVSAEELVTLSEFLRQNGVTENAAVSLSASTGDFSAATDSSLPTSDEFRPSDVQLNPVRSASFTPSGPSSNQRRDPASRPPKPSRLKRKADGELVSDRTSERPNGVAMSSSTTMENSHHKTQSSGGFRGLFNKLRKPSEHASQVQVGTRVYDANEIQKLIPQLEETIEKKNRLLQHAQEQIEDQQTKISQLEGDIKTLQSECDKLRSVLSQKAESVASPPTPQPKSSQSDDPHAEINQEALQKKVLPTDIKTNEPRAKKLAVSAEPAKLESKATLQHHPKSAGSKQMIRDAVQKNDFLRQLAKEQVIELVECMFEMRARAGQWIIQEGEPGDRLFVVAEGQLQVSREGQALGVINTGVVMGELAILYNCTRTASVQALTDVVLWVLDRSAFQMITMRLGMERHTQLMNFLHKVSIFENLPEDRISKMADVMDQDYYAGGHYILREGEKGDTFFVINSGQVQVTQTIEGEDVPREIRVLKQGDFFGERALLGDEVRTANVIAMNPGVEVLTLDRESFLKLIGDLEALKRDYGDLQRRATITARAKEHPSPVKEVREPNEYSNLQLRQLKRIATLGVGGFGRVELVCIGGDKSRTFALKALKKKHIVDTRQQEHIFAERNIMMETRNDWIVRLYTTFRDSKYVYMLLEACLGGELWTTLRDRGHFDDYTARFYVACVLEGLEFLHHKTIVYRDLKPENCLLTTSGYLKLVDFGFAKRLASGRKTWTFCGTPEYVSPEIILNKGHDQAADYWALGIYICELMLGRPPFQASDPMKTYTLILKGIDALEIPNRRIGKTATALVKKLCRDNPGERLGSGSGGVNDIRKHRWFMGFDWEGLRTRTLKPPIIPKVTNPADVSNFDNYPPDQDVPPDEFSGWDEGF